MRDFARPCSDRSAGSPKLRPRASPLRNARADIACLFAFLLVALFALSLPGLLFLVSLKAFFPSYATGSSTSSLRRSCSF